MCKVRCHYCGKELDSKEAAVVPRFNRNFYFCPEHRGIKTERQRILEIVLDVINEGRMRPVITEYLDPVFNEHGYEKVSRLLYDKYDHYSSLFEDKGKHFRLLEHKMKYFLKLLNADLSHYQYEKPPERSITVTVYEPEFDTHLNDKVIFERKETNEDKKNRLLKKMDESDPLLEDEPIYTSIFAYLQSKSKTNGGV